MIINYNDFIQQKLLIESLNTDDKYLISIFNSICEYHLSYKEKQLLFGDNFTLNENIFTTFKDKATRGVLAAKTEAGKLLVDVMKKATDILNFVTTIVNSIKTKIVEVIKSKIDEVVGKAFKIGDQLLELITTYLNSKNIKLIISRVGEFIKFITVDLPVKIYDKLISFFNTIFSEGKNEGFDYFCNDFLNENNEDDDQKTFLVKLSEKIQNLPPFSYIPDMDQMMKDGVDKVKGYLLKFLTWIDETKEVIFEKSLKYIFDILIIYSVYKINESEWMKNVNTFKEFLTADLTKTIGDVKNKAISGILSTIGIDTASVVNTVKSLASKIPYISDILEVFNIIAIGIGIYKIIEPHLADFKTEKTVELATS